MLRQPAFIYYSVSDMDRAVDFYGRVLGLPLLFQREDWSEFDAGGMRLALHLIKKAPPVEGGAVVSFHADPIEEVIETLKQRGAAFDEEPRVFPYGKTAAFRDSEGNRLELYQPPAAPSHRR